MRIGIDCRMLGSAQGGLGRYVEQLVVNLSKYDTENEYVLFLRAENINFTVQNSAFKYKKVLADIPWYGWREQLFFSRIIRAEKVELMHFPHWNIPLFPSGKFVVTIHDLLLLSYPTRAASKLGPVSYWFKNLAFRLVLKNAVRLASHIITTSQFTKADIVKKLLISPNKITPIYQAPFLTGLEYQTDSKKIFQITKPYLLYIGVAYPHKNLDRLVEAWAKVNKVTNGQYQLVLAGKDNFFYQRIKEKVSKVGIANIVFTDFVNDADLPGLYASAELFIYPSLYEGFGLPPLEAWQYQVPVVAARAACLPEILGSGAAYFDPESVDNMAEMIIEVLVNSELRDELKRSSEVEKKRFSWSNFTEQTLSIYQQSHTQVK